MYLPPCATEDDPSVSVPRYVANFRKEKFDKSQPAAKKMEDFLARREREERPSSEENFVLRNSRRFRSGIRAGCG